MSLLFTFSFGAILWDETRPAINTQALQEYEKGVLCCFTLPYVIGIGSNQGCGCGFRHAQVWDKDWLPVVEADADSFTESQQNHIELSQFIAGNVAKGLVEIYACWNGDVYDCPGCAADITIADIADEGFYFKEGWRYKVLI